MDQIAAWLSVFDELTIATSKYEVVVLEGCDGTGKTTIACALAERHGYAVIHSDRPPDAVGLAEHYREILALPGKMALDRSFIRSASRRSSSPTQGSSTRSRAPRRRLSPIPRRR